MGGGATTSVELSVMPNHDTSKTKPVVTAAGSTVWKWLSALCLLARMAAKAGLPSGGAASPPGTPAPTREVTQEALPMPRHICGEEVSDGSQGCTGPLSSWEITTCFVNQVAVRAAGCPAGESLHLTACPSWLSVTFTKLEAKQLLFQAEPLTRPVKHLSL